MSAEAFGPCAGRVPRSSAPLRGLLFDMEGILHDDTLWRRWLWQLALRLGATCEYAGFFDLWDREHLGPVHRGQRNFHESLRAFLLQVGLSRAQADEVEAASQARRRDLVAASRPLPGVRTTLARLKQAGLVLGVLCDDERPGKKIREHLTAMRIGDAFATVVSSYDLGHTQPDSVCYQRALAGLQLSADEVMFVGHHPLELAGARAAGMATAAVNHKPEAAADVFLVRFEDLPDCVLDWRQEPRALQGAA